MDNENKDSKELEREVREHRREAVDSFHDLDEGLTPGKVIDNYYFGNEKPSLRNFIARLKDDPVPGALMGAAVAWSTSAEKAREQGITYDSVSRTVKEQVSEVKGRISETKESVAHKKDEMTTKASQKGDQGTSKMDKLRDDGQSMVDSAKDSARSTMDSAKDTAYGAQRKVRRGLESEPLINLALGFSLGAALGSMTPLSQKEEEWLSSTAEGLKQEASGMKDQAKQMAKDKAQDVRDTLIQP